MQSLLGPNRLIRDNAVLSNEGKWSELYTVRPFGEAEDRACALPIEDKRGAPDCSVLLCRNTQIFGALNSLKGLDERCPYPQASSPR